ncbi:MAG: rod shape-determining protein MreD, partial [Bacteroidia bacterium]|nr:rod shape-determining protein MreD [Bacteroidia bacterium]
MIRIVNKNIWRFILLVLLQVLILNNIRFSGFINPYVYVMFILLLPFETPKWLLIISAFLIGISVDYFSDTMGMHAAASVCMAYFRPHILGLIAPRDTYEAGTYPQMNYFGFTWFVQYCLILTFIHHSVLFFAEVFT